MEVVCLINGLENKQPQCTCTCTWWPVKLTNYVTAHLLVWNLLSLHMKKELCCDVTALHNSISFICTIIITDSSSFMWRDTVTMADYLNTNNNYILCDCYTSPGCLNLILHLRFCLGRQCSSDKPLITLMLVC